MSTTEQPVILMRPSEANNRLASALKEVGIDSWCWPAFEISLPSEEESEIVRSRLSNLDSVEMVILPSPASVAAVSHWVSKWPAHLKIATVGEGTAKFIRAAWGEEIKVVYPPGDAEHSGSEALWELLHHRGAPSRVLFLRGQTGREWLPEQFRQLGADVITLCAYRRTPIELTDEQKDMLRNAAVHMLPPVIYITSTDAVDAFFHELRSLEENVREWITSGTAVTLHPRVVLRLEEAGFRKIEVTSTDISEVVEHIKSNHIPSGGASA